MNPATSHTTLKRWSWFALAYTVAVILWGAFVRATGSGAGCGDHWPLCDGQVIPREMGVQRMIEFTHRVTSGLSLILVLLVSYFAHRTRLDHLKKPLRACVVFILLEAALGAGLVLFKLVAHDQSLYRVVSVTLHLVNTLCLVAAQTVLACEISQPGFQTDWRRLKSWRDFWIGVAGFFVIGATGAVTALGDTLFPVGEVHSDHILTELRILHPFVALAAGAWIISVIFKAGRSLLGNLAIALILFNWSLGLVNVLLKAPVWIQMVHLLIANLTWIYVIRFGLEQSRRPQAHQSRA